MLNQTHNYLSVRTLLSIVLLCTATGCGKSGWQASTYPVSGVIKINGESPEKAVLIFHSTAGPVDRRHSEPWAIVESDGSFEISTYKDGDGAPKGEYAVTLYWPAYSFMDAPDRLKGVYNDVNSPLTTVLVTSGENHLPSIELTNVKLAPPVPSPF